MADLFPVAGAKIYIGGVLPSQADDFDEADFSGESWVEIDGWQQMGAVGDTANVIETGLINRGRTVKQKGTRNAGSSTQRFAILPTDTGQVALIAAEKTRNNYAFKIEFDDNPDPSPGDGTPTTLYFVALVTSAQETGGEADTVRMLEANLEINSNVVNVAADIGTP